MEKATSLATIILLFLLLCVSMLSSCQTANPSNQTGESDSTNQEKESDEMSTTDDTTIIEDTIHTDAETTEEDLEHFSILAPKGEVSLLTEKQAAYMAESVLADNGYLIKAIDVVGVKIGDEPGKLTEALDILDKAGMNVEYLYAFMTRTEKHAYVVLRVEDNAAAEVALTNAGFNLISEADICKL